MNKLQKVHYKWVYLKNRLEYEKEVSPFKVKDRFGEFLGEAWYYFKIGTGKERFCYMLTAEQRKEELVREKEHYDRYFKQELLLAIKNSAK